MGRWLKEKPRGIYRVLHSAAALRRRRIIVSAAKREQYRTAYAYLRKRMRWLDYRGYRRDHLPIGSGVTEAACKTVFTQRMKQSGMTWKAEGGQWIVDLRVIHLSGVWTRCINPTWDRRTRSKWGLKGLQRRESPQRPHNRWHRHDCTPPASRSRPGQPPSLGVPDTGQAPTDRIQHRPRNAVLARICSFDSTDSTGTATRTAGPISPRT